METINLRINYLAETFFKGNNVRFAEKVESSEANIRNYRKSLMPKIEFVVKTCEILNINFDWLLTGKGEILRNTEEKKEESSEDLQLFRERLDGYKELNGIYLEKITYLQNKLNECQSEKKRV